MAQRNATYMVCAEPCICQCTSPRKVLSTCGKLDRATQVAAGHWTLYLNFWGTATHWLDIIVVDTRDGVIEWKNGKPTREVSHGESQGATGGDDGPRWLGGGTW